MPASVCITRIVSAKRAAPDIDSNLVGIRLDSAIECGSAHTDNRVVVEHIMRSTDLLVKVTINWCGWSTLSAIYGEVPLATATVQVLSHTTAPGQSEVCVISSFLERHADQLSVVGVIVEALPGLGPPTYYSTIHCTLV